MRIRTGMRWPGVSWVWAGMSAGVRNCGSSGRVRFGRNGGSSEWIRARINAWVWTRAAFCKENMTSVNKIKSFNQYGILRREERILWLF